MQNFCAPAEMKTNDLMSGFCLCAHVHDAIHVLSVALRKSESTVQLVELDQPVLIKKNNHVCRQWKHLFSGDI